MGQLWRLLDDKDQWVSSSITCMTSLDDSKIIIDANYPTDNSEAVPSQFY